MSVTEKESNQDTPTVTDKDQGLSIFSCLLAGIGFYGILGGIADHFLHTSFLTMIGLLIGMGVSFYIIFKRYGRDA